MSVQKVLAPMACPGCGGDVCFEFGFGPRDEDYALHCRRTHDDDEHGCEWRQYVPIDPDADEVVVVSDIDAFLLDRPAW